jgi:hypothetical protein
MTRAEIDAADYETLLRTWRFTPIGDAVFTGPDAVYFKEVMLRKKYECGNSVEISKRVGWRGQ